MKVEGESESTMQSSYEGLSPQTHNKNVNAVLLQDGWHSIIPGTFKLHKTPVGEVPFVRFQLHSAPVDIGDTYYNPHTVEIFPMGLHGIAYPSALPVNGEKSK